MNILKIFLFLLITVSISFKLSAQHDHEHHHHDETDSMKMVVDSLVPEPKDTLHNVLHNVHIEAENHSHSMHQYHMTMNGAVLLTDGMMQEGSGTSWQPASSPMHMFMYHSGSWMFMLHGSISPRYTHQGGLRGKDKFSSPNWLMASGQTMLGMNTQIMFRTMLSIDRLTEGGEGYPLLFQTGETWKGEHLVDIQHPHDMIAELSTSISGKFSKTLSGFLYLGYPGEPALGPGVFMHRPSDMSNPEPPISHHWQDATHITFGVGTIGLVYKNIKLEGSVFTGREPDENRFAFDKPRFDSYSGRVSYNPNKDISFQSSVGFIKNPEGDSLDVIRRTASLQYNKKFNSNVNLASALIWGQNKDSYAGAQNSYILESEMEFFENSVYTRLEGVQKTQHELDINDDPAKKETIGVFTLGYRRVLFQFSGLDFSAGLQGSVYSVPGDLKKYYGSNPFSYLLYINIMPGL